MTTSTGVVINESLNISLNVLKGSYSIEVIQSTSNTIAKTFLLPIISYDAKRVKNAQIVF